MFTSLLIGTYHNQDFSTQSETHTNAQSGENYAFTYVDAKYTIGVRTTKLALKIHNSAPSALTSMTY